MSLISTKVCESILSNHSSASYSCNHEQNFYDRTGFLGLNSEDIEKVSNPTKSNIVIIKVSIVSRLFE